MEMINSIHDTVVLNNGIAMPRLGLGLYKVDDGSEIERAVAWALEAGYRSFDSAQLYGNEQGLGRALGGVDRDSVFVTTKVWNSHHGRDKAVRACEESLHRLGMDYVDLYLIHWPVPGRYLETWQALEELYRRGLCRAIGVSNFNIHHLEDVLKIASVKPAVNQVEFHPRLVQAEMHDFCRSKNIQLEAWRPLMGGSVRDIPLIDELSKKYGKTASQIVIRWHLQKDIIVIPKSVHRERIFENVDVFDFTLSNYDIKAIDSLSQNMRLGPDPEHVTF